jgi:hypothetical protein
VDRQRVILEDYRKRLRSLVELLGFCQPLHTQDDLCDLLVQVKPYL